MLPANILPQCAAVNFVSGSMVAPCICTNKTSRSPTPTFPSSTLPATSTSPNIKAVYASAAKTISQYTGLDPIVWLALAGFLILMSYSIKTEGPIDE